MKILVFGGTRHMGVHLVDALIKSGHDITIATRGNAPDSFGSSVKRIIADRLSAESIRQNIGGDCYDIIFDSLAYCSQNIKDLLDNVNCKHYVYISSTALYDLHLNSVEADFNPLCGKLIYARRDAFNYAEGKRQAERALFQDYPHIKAACARFPFVIGSDDYLRRLHFYVEAIIMQRPIFVDNYDVPLSFVFSDEAGQFLAFLGENRLVGAYNGACSQPISLSEICAYVTSKTGLSPVLSKDGAPAPYNGFPAHSIVTKKAEAAGFYFSSLENRIYPLLDILIAQAQA